VSTLGLLVSIVGGLFGLLVTTAAVVAFLRANLAKTTIETQRTTIVAFETRIAQVEGDNKRCTERIAALEAENATLRSIVSGVDELKRMRVELTNHKDEVKNTHDQILTGIYAMHDLMIELLKRHVVPPEKS
jgi:hypothetical protein